MINLNVTLRNINHLSVEVKVKIDVQQSLTAHDCDENRWRLRFSS